jgi:lysophospholipase L1-like esterase
MRLRSRRLLIGLVCALTTLGAAPAALADSDHATTYYLSLGDSLAVGTQPIGTPPLFETDQGYADQLYDALRAGEPKLRHVRLGCGGESTTSMLEGSQDPAVAFSCGPPGFYLHRYPHKTQLAEAVAFLRAHAKHTALVTIDIGANDVLGPGGASEIVENLPVILAELRAAAGPDVPIVGMNYWNPTGPGVWFATQDLALLEADIAGLLGFNDFLEGFFAAVGMPVADVESAFSTTDLTLVGGVPVSVLRVCAWTWICAPPPLGPDIHPNAVGYGVIARAFLDVVVSAP